MRDRGLTMASHRYILQISMSPFLSTAARIHTESAMRIRIGLLLLLLPVCIAVTQAQHNETLREIVREKLRIDPARFEELLQRAAQSTEQATEITASPRATKSGVETVVSGDPLPESEVHAAINPLDPTNMVVSAMRLDGNNPMQALLCPIYFTRDGGNTWKKSTFRNLPTRPGSLVAGGGDPVFVYDANGTVYFSWINLYLSGMTLPLYMSIFWAYSTDGGENWLRADNDVLAEAEIMDLTRVVDAADKQWMAADRTNSPYRGRVYAAYLHAVNERMSIVLRRKLPQSLEFEIGEVRVSTPDLAFAQFTSIDVDADGGVHVIYLGSVDQRQYALYHALSTDGGASFAAPVKITDVVIPKWSEQDSQGTIEGLDHNRVYPCPHVALDRSSSSTRGRVHVVWSGTGITEKRSSGADIYHVWSDDRGASWSQPRVVNDDTALGNADQFHPSLAVGDDGTLAVSWYDRRDDAANMSARYTIAVSRDGGASFSPSTPVAAAAMDIALAGQRNNEFSIGEYTQVLLSGSTAIPFWADGRSNDGDIDVYSARIDVNTLSVERSGALSADFRLDAAQPNPFTESTMLSFHSERPRQFRLTLLDMLGRTVRELYNELAPAGETRLRLDARDLPSGSYTLLLRSDGAYASRSVVLIR